MSQADDILNRMIAFALAITKACRFIPRNRTTSHICGQLLRSATAVAPNYAEARAAESPRDFIHKLGIVLKELNESLVWLKMLQQMGPAETTTIGALAKECDELCRIVYSSIKTASRHSCRKNLSDSSVE